MSVSNKQNGNILISSLGFAILVVCVIVGFIIAMYPNQSIDDSKNKELSLMVADVKPTTFNTLLSAKINYAMEDGKISNSEFREIKEFYTGYKTAQLTNSEQNFVKQNQNADTQAAKEKQKAETKSIVPGNKFVLFSFMFFGLIILLIFIRNTIKAQNPSES